MQISHIKITNILGIDEVEFSPNGFTKITGPNGQGKTSVLEAIKSATGQGHDATLLRKGAEKGEIVLVLDDGTEIHERVTATRTTRDVIRDGKKLTKPSDTIKAITDALSVNPVEFLTARKQDRVQVLLESMPLELDAAKLSELSGIDVQSTSTHALAVIDHVRKQVYDDRTGTNRAIKEKDATINQLRTAMPDAVGGVEGDEDSLRAQVQASQTATEAETKRIDDKLNGLRDALNTKVQSIKDEAQAKIDAIRTEAQATIDAARAEFADTEATAGRVRQKAIDTHTATIQPLNQAIAAIASNRAAAAKRQATIDTIAQMATELEDLHTDAARQTKAIEDIDAYKEALLASLPIPRLEVRDGEIWRDGVAFDRLNTAQRVEIAFEIAKLRSGELPIVCLDGMELLDDEHLAALQEQAKESGVQVFVTRVGGGKFAVETE